MRLSVLALFIALPAAAYAAVHPRQCLDAGFSCKYDGDCCAPMNCRSRAALYTTKVCLMVHFL